MIKMKLSLSFFIRTLAVINLFLPVCTVIFNIFGCKFSLFNYTVCAVIFAVISVACVVCSFISKEKISKKSDTAALVFLPFITLADISIYLYEGKLKAVVTACVLICFVCSAVMVIKYVKNIFLKILSITVSSLAIFPIALFVGIMLDPFPKITVVNTVPSPEGAYYAQVTDVDTGALGGNTCVHIHKTKKLDFLLFNAEKTPERIYLGEWKAYEDMQIQWSDEHHIVIDEIIYTIE